MKVFLSTFLFLFSFTVIGQKIPPRPNPPRLVNDYTGTLTADQVSSLEKTLVAFDDSTSNQIVVAIVNTLDGYEPAEYGLELGRKWGVGNKKTNNGVVLLIALEDHKVNISTGYGLEGALPDVTCAQIIDHDITPQFKKGNYYRGIDAGVTSIMKATQGEYKAPADYKKKKNKKPGIGTFLVILFFVILILAAGKKGGGGGGMISRRGYGGLSNALWWMALSGLGGRSSGGGSSGGNSGGFGGFGGGSFGGGGASGSW